MSLLQVFSYESMGVRCKQAVLLSWHVAVVRHNRYLCVAWKSLWSARFGDVRRSDQSCTEVVSFRGQEHIQRPGAALTHVAACALDFEVSCFPAR